MTTTTLRRRLLSTAVLIPALAVALTGCTFGFSPDGPPSSGTGAPPSSEPVEPGTETPGGEDADDVLTREGIAAAATRQVTCGGGELEVSDIGVAVEVTDDCARLVVSGDGAIVLGAAVDELVVDGVGAVAFVASADTVVVTGDGSAVLWESGSPSIDDTSVGSLQLPAGAQG